MAAPLPESFTTDLEVPITSADYYMSVGSGGFKFVAALMAYVRPWGPQFPVEFTQRAHLRAASTLAYMAIVRGETFQFIREAVQFTYLDAAAFLGVSVTDIVDWESNLVPIPRSIWDTLAMYVCEKDMRGFTPGLGFNPDFRARVIRVRIDMPFPSQPFIPSPCPPDPCRR
jgi:hypothetical protein